MSSAPYYSVDSYDQIKQDREDLPGVAYPAPSKYEGFEKDKEFVREGTMPTVHRSAVIHAQETEDFPYQETDKLGDGSDNLYPSVTRAGSLPYVVDISKYRYTINAQTILLPSEQASATFEERMAQAHDEVFVLIDSVLDQKGAPQ